MSRSIKEYLEDKKIIVEGNTLGDAFSKLVSPIVNSLSKAERQYKKIIEDFTKKIFKVVEPLGIKEYDIESYSGISSFSGGSASGIGIGFRPNVAISFYYDEGANFEKAAKILKKAYNAGFVNPQVNSRDSEKGKYYIAVDYEEGEVVTIDLNSKKIKKN